MIALALLLLLLHWTPSAGYPALVAFQTLWPITSNNTDGASIAVDASGGVHLAFAAYTAVDGEYPAYYAYCSAGCGNLANWTVTAVHNIGVFGGSVRLEVNAAGQPRMLWYRQVSISEDGVYQYAQCSSNCTNASNWGIATLYADAVGPGSTRYFALNHQGNPRFLYTDTDVINDHEGTFYAYCDASCTSAANWHEAQISTTYMLYDFSLAFTPTGAARLAFRHAGMDDTVAYAECSASCQDPDNWNDVTLVEVLGAYGAFSLDLDPQGRPRLAVYSGYFDASSPDNDLLWYGWCNSNCLAAASWSFDYVGLPANYGKGVELVVDAQDRLHLAYLVEDIDQSIYGLGYTLCTANCTGTAPVWEDSFVETDATLAASNPIDVAPGCSISGWLDVGKEPSLAVDALGQPRFGFTAVHYQGGTCSIREDIRLVRYGQAAGSTPPIDLPNKVYVPMTTK
jgi:hypothetical protein